MRLTYLYFQFLVNCTEVHRREKRTVWKNKEKYLRQTFSGDCNKFKKQVGKEK